MPETKPRSVRFEPSVTKRLISYVATHPGLSAGSATNRFVDEGLRMEEHPGVFFRTGASGRRAVLVGGPDVWEVIRGVHSARSAEPKLDSEEIIQLVAQTSGIPERMIRIAVSYWAAFPDEIEVQIAGAQASAKETFTRHEREHQLFAA